MSGAVHIAEQFLGPIKKYLSRDGVTELCIYRPGELFIETSSGWEYIEDESLTYQRLDGIVKAVANHAGQSAGKSQPIMSATLPAGERVQVVAPPAVRANHLSITVRKHSPSLFTLDDYERQGAFLSTTHRGNSLLSEEKRRLVAKGITDIDRSLHAMLEAGDVISFLKASVTHKKNIVVSGSTGSGKTTLMRALIDLVGRDERLLSIENVDELMLDRSFPNAVPMFYSASGTGRAPVSQRQLMESSLRMKPDRIFVAELIRGDEAFDFLQSINSGHPGSITSLHANSARLAFSRLAVLLKQSETGGGMDYDVLRNMLSMTIDIVIQINRVGQDRKVTEIYFDPEATLYAAEAG